MAVARGSALDTYSPNITTRVASIFDQPKLLAAALLIDFREAFNRMQHRTYLSSLKYKGALPMVGGFLRQRSMQFE